MKALICGRRRRHFILLLLVSVAVVLLKVEVDNAIITVLDSSTVIPSNSILDFIANSTGVLIVHSVCLHFEWHFIFVYFHASINSVANFIDKSAILTGFIQF